MASPVAADKILSRMAIRHYDFDPDSALPVDVAWVDMRDFENFACSFMRTIGAGDVDQFRIIANNASDGSGTDVEIATHAVGSQPDAVGDQIWLECTAEQIAQEGADAGIENLRYVSAQVEFATSTDEGVVTYVRGNGRFEYDGLTADIVA